jgi:RNA polymerase sigma-70 factor, ECF subfamily
LNLNKEKLVIEAAQRERAYFSELFDEYYPAILNYSIKRTGDVAVAQDITSETFFKALVNIDKFKWRGISISNWFYKIANNEIRMLYRKNKYQPASLDALFAQGLEIADQHEFTQEIIAAQDEAERNIQYINARSALAKLPLKYQEIITLRFAEKKKLSEIALILDKKEGTVKSLLSRGLAKLRKQLDVDATETQPNCAPSIIASEGHILISREAYEE